MFYFAEVRWSWKYGGFGKERFKRAKDAFETYKKLKKDPRVRNLSIVY